MVVLFLDRDKDGINDDEDKCPDVPGVAKNNGCPETPEVTCRSKQSTCRLQDKVSISVQTVQN